MSTDSTTLTIALDHVGIDVNDFEAQVDFYRRAFDLTVEVEQDLPAFRFKLIFLLCEQGWRLELYKREGAVAGRAFDPDTQHDVLGIGHMCFSVSDLEATYERLINLGATSLIAPTVSPDPSVRMAYVDDPEGNLIELLDRTNQSTQVGG